MSIFIDNYEWMNLKESSSYKTMEILLFLFVKEQWTSLARRKLSGKKKKAPFPRPEELRKLGKGTLRRVISFWDLRELKRQSWCPPLNCPSNHGTKGNTEQGFWSQADAPSNPDLDLMSSVPVDRVFNRCRNFSFFICKMGIVRHSSWCWWERSSCVGCAA